MQNHNIYTTKLKRMCNNNEHTRARNAMSFMTLVDMNCEMITGISHSNDPIVQVSDIEKIIVRKADTMTEPVS